MRRGMGTLLIAAVLTVAVHAGQPGDADALRAKVVDAVGGREKLLKLFRIKERLNVTSDPEAKGNERISILEPPKHWWVGKTERVSQEKEPATFLVWAWTLGALVDAKSKVTILPDIKDGETAAFGLRISETISPPMDLYFSKSDQRLIRIDWRQDIHRFSAWKEAHGTAYPSKTVGYKKSSGKAWYFSEILELESISELPKGLKRPMP